MVRFTVYVVPRSTRLGPDGTHGGLPRLRVSAPASEGRANDEAQKLLRDLLSARVRLVSGQRSRKKIFEVDLGRQVLDARLRDAFGGRSGRD